MDKDLEQWFRQSTVNDILDMIDQSGPYTEEDIERYDMVNISIDTIKEVSNAVVHGEVDKNHNYHLTANMEGPEDVIFRNCERIRHVPEDELRAIILDELKKHAGVNHGWLSDDE